MKKDFKKKQKKKKGWTVSVYFILLAYFIVFIIY